MTCIVQLVGPSGSGKTRVIVSVSRRLKNLGFKVAVVKHTHHHVDVPGKDSWRFIEEGGADYAVVLRGSGERVAVFTRDQSIDRVVGELSKTVDVILVEGFKDLRLGYKVELGEGENLEEVSEKVLEELLECLRKAGRA
jgi:molybdopterin-guanine dinucleotide biosynthesis protein B